ncbi:hypothetical protein HDU93_008089, partial [Gonapodya sp. JEL0774]
MSSTVYLVTGANRGIGKGLVTALLLRQNTVVIAGVRDPSRSTDLGQLPTGKDSRLIVVKYVAGDDASASDAIKALQDQHQIVHIDVVIANAGIASLIATAAESPASGFRDHFEVNTIAPVLLFQATLPLLVKSSSPKFVAISSGIGSVGDMESMP